VYTMGSDQRKTIRFKPKKRSFATLDSKLNQVGKIIDIGLGGLSFEFIGDEKPSEKVRHVDIFTLDETFSLSELPCTLVHESASAIPGNKEGHTGNLLMWKCSIRFGDLQREHWCGIADFLENCTSPEDQFSRDLPPDEEGSGEK
jgi:hypothetical protein